MLSWQRREIYNLNAWTGALANSELGPVGAAAAPAPAAPLAAAAGAAAAATTVSVLNLHENTVNRVKNSEESAAYSQSSNRIS